MSIDYSIEKTLVGGLSQDDSIVLAKEIEEKFRAISEICKDQTLKKYTDDYHSVLDILGKIVVAFGGKYERVDPNITEDKKEVLLGEMVATADQTTKTEIQNRIQQLKEESEEKGVAFSENSDDTAAIQLEEIAKSKNVSIESILGDGHTEIRTEDEEFKVLNTIANM